MEKKYNEIQLIKIKMDLNIQKMTNHPPSPVSFRTGEGRVFYILLYYFINVMIQTLYISNFIVVYVIYFTHSLYCHVLMCFSLLMKSYTFPARNPSSSTFFDLDE